MLLALFNFGIQTQHVLIYLKLIRESVLFAFHALSVNLLRTFLSLLGITIGIFTIILVFTIVDSLEKNVRQSVESLGENVIFIQKWPWAFGSDYPWWKYWQRPLPTFKEMDEIKARSTAAEAMVFQVFIGGKVLLRGLERRAAALSGRAGDVFERDGGIPDLCLGRKAQWLDGRGAALGLSCERQAVDRTGIGPVAIELKPSAQLGIARLIGAGQVPSGEDIADQKRVGQGRNQTIGVGVTSLRLQRKEASVARSIGLAKNGGESHRLVDGRGARLDRGGSYDRLIAFPGGRFGHPGATENERGGERENASADFLGERSCCGRHHPSRAI